VTAWGAFRAVQAACAHPSKGTKRVRTRSSGKPMMLLSSSATAAQGRTSDQVGEGTHLLLTDHLMQDLA